MASSRRTSLGARRHRGGRPAGEDCDQAAAGCAAENAPDGATISGLLDSGRDRRLHRAAAAGSVGRANPNIGWLFPDPVAAAKDYYRRTGIFPIMHLVGIRRTLAEQHPWLPGAVFKAFEQAKAVALAKLAIRRPRR